MNNPNDRDLYTIPPNFIGSSTFLGGMFKVRNVIEAGILAVCIGIPVLFFLPCSLTVRMIVLCLTALPSAMLALVGIGGESLSSFILIYIRFLKNRRIVGKERKPAKKANKPPKESKPHRFRKHGKYEKIPSPKSEKEAAQQEAESKQNRNDKQDAPVFFNPTAAYFPIPKIENGIIYTKDRRYVKIIEVIPINFMLRSDREKRNIIYSFVSYLKISPSRVQFKVLTRRADINLHMDTVRREIKTRRTNNAG